MLMVLMVVCGPSRTSLFFSMWFHEFHLGKEEKMWGSEVKLKGLTNCTFYILLLDASNICVIDK